MCTNGVFLDSHHSQHRLIIESFLSTAVLSIRDLILLITVFRSFHVNDTLTAMPSPGAMLNRRFLVLLIATAGFLTFSFVMLFRRQPSYGRVPIHRVDVSPETLGGDVIMPKLGNETLK